MLLLLAPYQEFFGYGFIGFDDTGMAVADPIHFFFCVGFKKGVVPVLYRTNIGADIFERNTGIYLIHRNKFIFIFRKPFTDFACEHVGRL